MPRTSTRTRNINANGRPTALSEQDTNSPNIINNIKQRSNVAIKTNHLAKAGGQIGKSLSNIAIYQDEKNDGSENLENQIVGNNNNNQAKSPGRKRGPKGRFVSPNRNTKSTECQATPEMKDFQIQVSFDQEMSSPTSSPLPQSQSSSSKQKLTESLQNELLLPLSSEIEQSTDPKYLKDIIAEQKSQIFEQSYLMEQMKLDSCQDREIIDKLEEANSALKGENEELVKQCEEKDGQIEELLQIAEA